MPEVEIAIQEHLGTGKYKEDFDTLIDRARKRLGPGGLFTITSTGDDRLPSDRRYEELVDKPSKRYHKQDIGGRATYVEGADITALNSLEMEIKKGHLLTVGLPRDTNLDTGKDVPFLHALEQTTKYSTINLIGHPTFIGGLAPMIAEDVTNGNLDYFPKIDGCAIYSGTANLIPGSNRKAIQFFRDFILPNFPHIAPYLEDDGHSSWLEFARVTTKIPKPKTVIQEGDELIRWLRQSFRTLASQGLNSVISENPTSITDRAIGFIGAVRHALDLKLIHPWRLRSEERLNK